MPRGNRFYDPVPVCAFCIENLASGWILSGVQARLICGTATAGSRNHLKKLPLSKLKKYADAYNLRSDQIIEKDDLVDRLMSYRVSSIVTIYVPFVNIPCRKKTGAYPQRTRYALQTVNRSY